MIRTILIDAEQKDREKIYALLLSHKDFEIQGLGEDGYDSVKLITRYKPDLAILDLNLEIINGVDVLPLLRQRSPATLLVVLVSKLNDNQIFKALSHKIAGFLLKGPDLDKLPVILKDIYFGKYYMSPQVSSRIFHIFSELSHKDKQKSFLPGHPLAIPTGISKTELQIMSCIGEGRSNKEIAEYLSLKAGTVRNYISSAMHKVGLRDRTQIAIYALKNGLVSSDNF